MPKELPHRGSSQTVEKLCHCEPVRTLLRAKSRLRRLRYVRGLRAVWRGNLLDFRTFLY